MASATMRWRDWPRIVLTAKRLLRRLVDLAQAEWLIACVTIREPPRGL